MKRSAARIAAARTHGVRSGCIFAIICSGSYGGIRIVVAPAATAFMGAKSARDNDHQVHTSWRRPAPPRLPPGAGRGRRRQTVEWTLPWADGARSS